MLPLFRCRTPLTASCLLLVFLLMGCSRASAPSPPPVLSSWSEQFAAMERALHELGGDFMLDSAAIYPVRDKPGAPDEPIELRETFLFISPKSTQTGDDGAPTYAARAIHFNDHRLATTLRVGDEFQTSYPVDPKAGAAARLIRLSPQDVLRLTLAEGQAFMGKPVYKGNISISLVRVSEIPPEVKAPAVWTITYYRQEAYLSLWIDAQSGAVLKRLTENKSAKTG